MKKLNIPNAPPDLTRQDLSPMAYARAVADWIVKMKSQVESTVNSNVHATGSHIVLGSYTFTTTFTSTDTTGDTLATLIGILQSKGILS